MNASKETIIRTIVLFVTLVNQVLTVCGKNPLPFSETELYEILSLMATAGVSLWTWWKNNSFTAAAVEADRYLADLKSGEVSV